ncbi:ABC transporter ATP-binding protein [Oharaeibacter diazotrophicus]|uniref:Carbohydrate ABC transporter ATP-binding protein (CUT1 family) n=2 Tax=Oharaeibacter diazotrophicus TaxID=1920512 RepID=A0A4R6RAF3_9HYPH|nr:sn-glycerol-3-phosphate ABC transporter ATP-binding protein UgpC [Oharaeibacter diazotrophicus]TDP83073.1 carbohydrate ABC transporter ATP-binding protein (CUT1 family) [Oharaeibacter diazotrophicus]BBE71904.1 sn-glycerol-3-phosphate import ATP-binding protein UgpC [Pleomorphomonas sp. SM30]GLS78667.1 sn-glycerol-3-phosphate import ATP-binding protein UgpC 2 [Oharaeibacter diazotrophicus]
MNGLVLSGVRKFYGSTEVVKGVDLEVADGEFVVILGPSGCGKSTLLRMVAGLEDVSAGEIRLAGEVVTHLPPRRRGVAMVFQNYALYPHLTVAGNIGYPLRVAGVAKAEREARVAEVARVVGLEALLARKPSQLSGGQRQRVAMARAIIRRPRIFLFDEPLSNLDAKLRGEIRAEIRLMHQRLGVTSVFVTHDQVEAMTLADRIVVMNTGRIEQVGAPTEVYRRPASRYVASFVGTTPMSFLDAVVGDDGASVRIGGAGTLALAGRLPPERRGRPVTVGLRAEGVAVADGGPLIAGYRLTEELGSHALHHTLVEGVVVLAAAASGDRPVGETLRLAVAPDAIHLFDADTGRRIEPEA